MNTTRFVSVTLASALSAPLAACEEYDPPPIAKLVQPAGNAWIASTPIELVFSEPIEPESLSLTIWPSTLDIEGEFLPGTQPIVSPCSLSAGCAPLELTLDEAGTRATILQNDAFEEGVPMILEVHAGLKDRGGRTRNIATRFDFQINPECGNAPVDIDLQTGVISLAANLQVLPIWLQMFVDLAVDKDTGRFQAIGTFARVNQDLTPTPPSNYNHPDGLLADISDVGWAVTFTGCLVQRADGEFFLQSDPFDVSIVVLNVIPVTLTDFQVQATLKTGAAADGRDTVAGTLSTSGGSFGDPPSQVEPITTAWDGFSLVPEEIVPGLPRVCEPNRCAELDGVGGDCQVPADLDTTSFCDE